MSWPLRMRLQSFAITLGLTVFEAFAYSLPLGLGAWLAGTGSPRAIAVVLGAFAAVWSLAIAIGTHVWPSRFAGADGGEKPGADVPRRKEERR